MNRKMIAWGSVALLISATGLAYALKGEGQGGASRGAGGRPTPVEMVKVESAPLVEDIRAVGTFLSNESTNIQPEVPGRITAILFQEGQAVKKGDTLIQLDDSIAKAELDKAQANYELAQLTHKRTA